MYKILFLQVIIFLLLINNVSADSVFGEIQYNIITDFGVIDIDLEAPSVYINQSFYIQATIRANESYNESEFNATIELPSTFSPPNNDINHSNPNLTGSWPTYDTNWTLNATVTSAGNYTINITVPFFSSSMNSTIEVFEPPPNFDNGSVIVDVGGPYNGSDTVTINAKLLDVNGTEINSIGMCNATIYYPNYTAFLVNDSLDYLAGSYGIYTYDFTAPVVDGNFSAHVNCSLPNASNTTQFYVNVTNTAPRFSNKFPITGSYIHRSDNNPTPSQSVDFYVTATDPDNDTINLTFYYSTDNLASFSNNSMTYDNETETWRTQIGGFPAQTYAYYFVAASDWQLSNRTPEAGYDILIWDNPPGDDGNEPGGSSPIEGDIVFESENETADEGEGVILIINYTDHVTVNQGGVGFATVSIKNNGTGILHDTFISINGLELDWYTITPELADIAIGETEHFVIKINPPLNAEIKNYTFEIRVEADEDLKIVRSVLEVISASEKAFRIVDVDVPALEFGKVFSIKIYVENQGTSEQEIILNIKAPEGFIMEKTEKSLLIQAGQTEYIEFEIFPLNHGIFNSEIIGTFGDQTISILVPLSVKHNVPSLPIPIFIYMGLLVIAVGIVGYAIIHYIRERAKPPWWKMFLRH